MTATAENLQDQLSNLRRLVDIAEQAFDAQREHIARLNRQMVAQDTALNVLITAAKRCVQMHAMAVRESGPEYALIDGGGLEEAIDAARKVTQC